VRIGNADSASHDISFFHVHISPLAIELATKALHSGWVSEGEVVKEFETRLAATLGVKNPVAVNSGTSALHLALVLCGVGRADEVILPAQTFVATGMVILMQGATPVFADIDPMTGNISPQSIAERITPRSRAIMPVHWGGYPCDLDEINSLARRHNLAVIEDAAHALGAAYKGRPIGSISRFTAFSFQAIKHLTTGDGGLLCCPGESDADAAFVGRWFGIDRADSKPGLLGARGYNIETVGYKYHMGNIAAAIGLGNLDGFPARLARRRQIATFYRSQLRGVSGLQLLRAEADREHAYWLFTILVDGREDFVRKLDGEGIPTSVVDLRIDQNAVFGGIRDDLPGQAEFNNRQIAIPLHDNLTDADVERIVGTIRSGW